MADPGTYRTKEEIEEAKKKDCIASVENKLVSLGYQSLVKKIQDEVEQKIQKSLKEAEEAPFPSPETVTDFVYV